MFNTTLVIFLSILTFGSVSFSNAHLYSNSNQVYLSLIKEVELGSEPIDILLNEGTAYVMTAGALYGFSTSDPYNITFEKYTGLGGTYSISFSGRTAYALNNKDYVSIYDFSKNPPAGKNTIRTNGAAKKIIIDNGYLYILNEDSGLQVYDVNVADFPTFKNTQILPASANGLFIKDKKAYITGAYAKLSIIDVADIAKLPIIGTYNNGVKFYEPYVDGNFAYVPQGNTGVQVLNISKLPTPEWVANIFGRKNSKQVVASNFYVWVLDENTIEGFFNKDSNAFLYAGNYKNNTTITKIALIEGKYIYMLTGDNKLKVLKIEYKY